MLITGKKTLYFVMVDDFLLSGKRKNDGFSVVCTPMQSVSTPLFTYVNTLLLAINMHSSNLYIITDLVVT